MDVGDAVYTGQAYPETDLNFEPRNTIAYVTGCERTNVAVSVVSNTVINSIDQASQTHSVVPDLSPAYIYHTKTPIYQLEFQNNNNNSPTCLIRMSNRAEILRSNYFYESIDDDRFITRPSFEMLHSIKLTTTESSTSFFSPAESIAHVSLHPQLHKLASVESRGSLSLYSVSEEDGRLSTSRFRKKHFDTFLINASHSSWNRVFWTGENTLFVGNRHELSSYDIREGKQSDSNSFINLHGNRSGPSFISDLAISPSNPQQLFGVVDSHLVWLDVRYPKHPILSLQHFFSVGDPSLKIDAVQTSLTTAENGVIKDPMMITLSSQISPSAAVYQVGTNVSDLPVSIADPTIYNLHPEYNTQTLRTLSFSPSNTGDSQQTPKSMYTVFQHSRDLALIQHVLSSDPLDSIDLSERYNPSFTSQKSKKIEYHDTLLRLTRGISDNDDPLEHVHGNEIKDLRPLVRLICDESLLGKETDNSAVSEKITERLKVLLKKHERGSFMVATLMNSDHKFNNPVHDISKVLFQIQSDLGDKIKLKSRMTKIRSLLYNSEVTSIEDLEKYMQKLWIEPLKKPAVSLQMLKVLQQRKQNKQNKHKVSKVIVSTPNSQFIKRIIRVPKLNNRKVTITPRSITYKPVYHKQQEFVIRRLKIINKILTDVALSHVTVSTKKNLTADKFVDKDLGVLRTYTNKFDKVGLSQQTREVLDIWKIKPSVSHQQASQQLTQQMAGHSQSFGGKPVKVSKKKSNMSKMSMSQPAMPSSSMARKPQSQSQSQSQFLSQSQGFMGSQSQSSQRKKKKRKVKEGFM